MSDETREIGFSRTFVKVTPETTLTSESCPGRRTKGFTRFTERRRDRDPGCSKTANLILSRLSSDVENVVLRPDSPYVGPV